MFTRISKSKSLSISFASSILYHHQLGHSIFDIPVAKIASFSHIGLTHFCFRSGHSQFRLQTSYSPCMKLHSERKEYSHQDSQVEDVGSCTRDVAIIQEVLKTHENDCQLESALDQCKLCVNEDLVVQVLRRHRSDWKAAFSFFNWVSTQKGYCHGSKAYNEVLDILGRMKQIKLMRQVFNEIPKERSDLGINERTFAVMMNRYAAAHKIQEAIDVFYMRKEYGFKLDMVSFQTLLMSLCRFKHVEEAEALFLKKQKEFPPVIKSRNIILNGWCVLGSSRDVKRFWNDIISSKCKPDLFTYSIFINSLTKAGKLGTAVEVFTSMWEKGCNPDVPICNTIIDQLCFKKKVPEALAIFGEMNERGCLPDGPLIIPL